MPQHQGDVRSIVQQDLPSERIGGATSRCSVDESSPVAVWNHAVVQVYVPPAIWMQYLIKQKTWLAMVCFIACDHVIFRTWGEMACCPLFVNQEEIFSNYTKWECLNFHIT